jgi:hypothetical protein
MIDFDLLIRKIQAAKMNADVNTTLTFEGLVVSGELREAIEKKLVNMPRSVNQAKVEKFMGMTLVSTELLPADQSYMFPRLPDAYTFVKLLTVLSDDGNTPIQSCMSAASAIDTLAKVRSIYP